MMSSFSRSCRLAGWFLCWLLLGCHGAACSQKVDWAGWSKLASFTCLTVVLAAGWAAATLSVASHPPGGKAGFFHAVWGKHSKGAKIRTPRPLKASSRKLNNVTSVHCVSERDPQGQTGFSESGEMDCTC